MLVTSAAHTGEVICNVLNVFINSFFKKIRLHVPNPTDLMEGVPFST